MLIGKIYGTKASRTGKPAKANGGEDSVGAPQITMPYRTAGDDVNGKESSATLWEGDEQRMMLMGRVSTYMHIMPLLFAPKWFITAEMKPERILLL
jgi:hypothetical protein